MTKKANDYFLKIIKTELIETLHQLQEWEKDISFEKLKNLLKKELAKHSKLKDIIIFGSFIKGHPNPKDIDLALLMGKIDYDLSRKIHENLENKIKNIEIHTTIVLFKAINKEPVWKHIIADGFSIKKNKYLRSLINLNKKEIMEALK